MSEHGAWPPNATLELARLMMGALSEALTPGEDGELRVITSRTDRTYFIVVDPARPGLCAGGIFEPDEGWRFFHARHTCPVEQLDVLEQLEVLAFTPSPLLAFATLFGS